MALFQTEPSGLEELSRKVEDWARSRIGADATGMAIHVDARQSHVGVLWRGVFEAPPTLPASLSACLLEQMAPLSLYHSVTPPSASAEPIRYRMAVQPAGPAHTA
jgi:hypothetical protein